MDLRTNLLKIQKDNCVYIVKYLTAIQRNKIDKYNNVDELQKYHAKWKKPVKKSHIKLNL